MTVTPSPQSVETGVSPVYTAAYDSIRKGAPGLSDATCQVIARSINMKVSLAAAPSSLAGGAFDHIHRLAVEFNPEMHDIDQVLSEINQTALAALSPEAPAREGVESFETVEARAEAWSDRAEIQRMVEATTGVFAKWSSPEILSRFRQQVMAVVQQAYIEGYDAALTPRHEAPAELLSNPQELEAPAEGAGEREAIARVVDPGAWALHDEMLLHTAARPAGVAKYTAPSLAKADAILALRARSSAPEAREGEASCPNGHQPGCECDVAEEDVARSKPAAAAPSADKLRIAVEALERIANLGVSSGPDDEPCHYAYRITRGAIRNARQALANQGADQ